MKKCRPRLSAFAEQCGIATRGRQGRFLLATLLCWTAARGYLLWPERALTGDLPAFLAPLSPDTLRNYIPAAATDPVFRPAAWAAGVERPMRFRGIDWSTGINAARLLLLRLGGGETVSVAHALRRATFAYVTPPEDQSIEPTMSLSAPLFPPQKARAPKFEAQAYLFWRPGTNTPSLAGHGELGGSQFAARIAVPLGHGLSASARAYAPLEHRGAEAAVGIDWQPLPGRPIRISGERRQRLDPLGRSAWSAYAAGGFWRGGGAGHGEIDGYAQAGVVGAERRDLFIDGALRIGYRLPTERAITIGAGLWGAAQPHAARLDVGPRLAITLPIEHHQLTLAIDGRFRTAGTAAPGSGAALTLAADF